MAEERAWSIEFFSDSYDSDVEVAALFKVLYGKYGSRVTRHDDETAIPEIRIRFDSAERAEAAKAATDALLDRQPCTVRVVAYVHV